MCKQFYFELFLRPYAIASEHWFRFAMTIFGGGEEQYIRKIGFCLSTRWQLVIQFRWRPLFAQ
jgi:hypothetical protein